MTDSCSNVRAVSKKSRKQSLRERFDPWDRMVSLELQVIKSMSNNAPCSQGVKVSVLGILCMKDLAWQMICFLWRHGVSSVLSYTRQQSRNHKNLLIAFLFKITFERWEKWLVRDELKNDQHISWTRERTLTRCHQSIHRLFEPLWM